MLSFIFLKGYLILVFLLKFQSSLKIYSISLLLSFSSLFLIFSIFIFSSLTAAAGTCLAKFYLFKFIFIKIFKISSFSFYFLPLF